jgi:hypothetical protein
MGILDSFGNTLDEVLVMRDAGGENFTLSFAKRMENAATGETRSGGGLQGMFKDQQFPAASKWSKAEEWLE